MSFSVDALTNGNNAGQQQQQQQQHLVLIGGGHAHAQVIKALNRKSRPKDVRVTLIDIQESASYSGMVPGCVAKHYTPQETLLELVPLCKWAGIDFITDEVIDMDLENNSISVRNSRDPIPFDAVSVDIGSASRGLDEIPGASEHTIPTRPISNLVRRIEEAEKDLPEKAHVVVVGGGAAGIELAMSIHGRWTPLLGQGVKVTLLDSGDELIPKETQECKDALKGIFEEKGIEVIHKCSVQEIHQDRVILQNGDEIGCTHCLWATGAAAHPLAAKLRERGLAVTERGWIRVGDSFQSVSHPCVFAAGDCSTMEGLPNGPPPKAGVYAVRAGPVLIENLTNFLKAKPLIHYKPQDDFLKLLVCGDGTALGFRFGKAFRGRWVFQMKDAIDRMFMDLFMEQNLPNLDDTTELDTSQYDAMQDSQLKLLPSEAATLLQRCDDNVDFNAAWKAIRDMTKDEGYRLEVLRCLNGAPVQMSQK